MKQPRAAARPARRPGRGVEHDERGLRAGRREARLVSAAADAVETQLRLVESADPGDVHHAQRELGELDRPEERVGRVHGLSLPSAPIDGNRKAHPGRT